MVVAVTVLLVWFDGRRYNEHLFHANLGTPVRVGVVVSLATAAALESALAGVLVAWAP